jgi:hypothetical protein
MDVPQSLLTSFQKFAEYPTNFVFEPNPTDVKLISYRDRLDKSTQTKYILVQFLDLEICMELFLPCAAPSRLMQIHSAHRTKRSRSIYSNKRRS